MIEKTKTLMPPNWAVLTRTQRVDFLKEITTGISTEDFKGGQSMARIISSCVASFFIVGGFLSIIEVLPYIDQKTLDLGKFLGEIGIGVGFGNEVIQCYRSSSRDIRTRIYFNSMNLRRTAEELSEERLQSLKRG